MMTYSAPLPQLPRSDSLILYEDPLRNAILLSCRLAHSPTDHSEYTTTTSINHHHSEYTTLPRPSITPCSKSSTFTWSYCLHCLITHHRWMQAAAPLALSIPSSSPAASAVALAAVAAVAAVVTVAAVIQCRDPRQCNRRHTRCLHGVKQALPESPS